MVIMAEGGGVHGLGRDRFISMVIMAEGGGVHG
jgi:hypothetical protein